MIGGTTSIDGLIEVCSTPSLAALDDVALARLGEELLTWWPKLDAARLRVLAEIDQRQAYRVDGARDAASWVAWKGQERKGAARRDVELAVTVSAMPAVAERLADGSLSKAKAAELGRAVSADPTVQEALADAAVSCTVEEVVRQIDRWAREQSAAPEVEETMRITPTGHGGRVEVVLGTENLEWLRVAVDTAAEKLGLKHVPWGQRQAHGLVAICRYFLDHADVPVKRQGRPTVVVTMDVEVLARTSGGSAGLDSGASVSGSTARTLACDAAIVRMITDPDSMPLDVGRATRSISPAQARAVIHRDRHCTYRGCSAPPWACDVHHLDPWGQGGRTDLARLRLLCWHHHHLTHRHETTHRLTEHDDGLELQPRTTDPPARPPQAA